MSFSVSAVGSRGDVSRQVRAGVPDAAITRAVESLMQLFPADAALSASASGHLGETSGGVTVSLSRLAPAVVAAPAAVPVAPEPEPPKEPAAHE